VSSAHEEVVVDAGDPVVNTTSQQTSGLIDERQVKELPLKAAPTGGYVVLTAETFIRRYGPDQHCRRKWRPLQR